jgi:hypothetical protein
MSLRSYNRVGDKISVFNTSLPCGTRPSVIDFVHTGSTVSIRSYGRFGCNISTLQFMAFASSLSLRQYCGAGSTLSIFTSTTWKSKGIPIKYTLSILDYATSEYLSLRNMSKFGSSLSILDYLTLSSSYSLRTSNTKLNNQESIMNYQICSYYVNLNIHLLHNPIYLMYI